MEMFTCARNDTSTSNLQNQTGYPPIQFRATWGRLRCFRVVFIRTQTRKHLRRPTLQGQRYRKPGTSKQCAPMKVNVNGARVDPRTGTSIATKGGSVETGDPSDTDRGRGLIAVPKESGGGRAASLASFSRALISLTGETLRSTNHWRSRAYV